MAVLDSDGASVALKALEAGLGDVQTRCIPVYPYEVFARDVLGVDGTEAAVFREGISPGGHLFWFYADVRFSGKILKRVTNVRVSSFEFKISSSC